MVALRAYIQTQRRTYIYAVQQDKQSVSMSKFIQHLC